MIRQCKQKIILITLQVSVHNTTDEKTSVPARCSSDKKSNPMQLYLSLLKQHSIQECIPVGCVPAAHWLYAGGVPPWRGVSLTGGVSLAGGGSPWQGGGGSPWQGGLLGRRVVSLAGGSLKQTPPPVDRITDKKHNLGHNFVAAGKKYWMKRNLKCWQKNALLFKSIMTITNRENKLQNKCWFWPGRCVDSVTLNE